jgi:hypothetical protein
LKILNRPDELIWDRESCEWLTWVDICRKREGEANG